MTKIRSGSRMVSAWIEPYVTNQVRVTFDESQMAPAPGQAAVFYKGDVVPLNET
nr:aminomethyltransferase beta-barrel domain-containing protein [Dehalogenimonas formicexedens]